MYISATLNTETWGNIYIIRHLFILDQHFIILVPDSVAEGCLLSKNYSASCRAF